jgi:hypothetical protein
VRASRKPIIFKNTDTNKRPEGATNERDPEHSVADDGNKTSIGFVLTRRVLSMKTLLRTMLVCLFVSQLHFICLAQVGIITTYVGPGLPVNGALATTQVIDTPGSVASDGAGGFYVASVHQNRVYRVTADGKLSLVAGNGNNGNSGDGGQATSAQLYQPNGLAVDSAGNLYIAQFNQIRKVTPGGVISTVAGGGRSGLGDAGPATSAQFRGPQGIAADMAGNLFIADNANQRIRKVSVPNASIGLALTAGGAGQSSTVGANQYTQPGYATVNVTAGSAPYV